MKKAYLSISFTLFFSIIILAIMTSCMKDSPTRSVENDFDTWTFSGTIVNGVTNKNMDKVAITYTNRDSKSITDSADQNGAFYIKGLSEGQQLIQFSNGETFTTQLIKVVGVRDGASGKLIDVSKIVKLFPLTGSVVGKVVLRKNDLASEVVTDKITVQIFYPDSEMITSSPNNFQVNTDSNGGFKLNKLPLADSAFIRIVNSNYKGIDYSFSQATSIKLTPNVTIPIGTLTMRPVNAVDFSIISTNFPSSIIKPNDTLEIGFTENVDSISYAVLQGDLTSTASNIQVVSKVDGKKLRVIPTVSLVDGKTYHLTIYGFGVSGGYKNQRYDIVSKGGGLADVVSSNILSANKTEIDGLGLSDSINFSFRINLIPSSSATIKKAGIPQLVTVSTKNNVLTIKPKGNWESATYDVIVNSVLEDGTPVNFTVTFATEGALKVVASNIYDPSTTSVKNGLGVNSNIYFKMNKAITGATAYLVSGSGANIPAKVKMSVDSLIIDPDFALNYSSSYTVNFSVNASSGETYSDTHTFLTGTSQAYVVASNVLSSDGLGLTNLPVNVNPYFVLSVTPDPTRIQATITGGGAPAAVVTTHGDKAFVKPVINFTYNASIGIVLSGADTNGNQINIDLSAAPKTFKTRQTVFVIASNTLSSNGLSVNAFPIYGEMWVKFSENLDTNFSKIDWSSSAATRDIYGKQTGANVANTTIRIVKDTLFVLPDTRLPLSYGETIGFQVAVTTLSGNKSAPIDFIVTTISSDLSAAWTNTKDSFGNLRQDVGLLEKIKLLPSVKVSSIKAVNTDGDGATSNPPDMTLDNVSLSGDTLVFQPSVAFAAGTNYGIQYTLDLQNGLKNQTLIIKWTTLAGVKIASTNTRSGGVFRTFKTMGDSLQVTFTKPIDTSSTALTRFKVNGFTQNYSVKWSASMTTATIKNIDSLKLATYGGASPYLSGSAQTKAYQVTFDLTTQDGERKSGLDLDVGNLEIHTEYGLAIVGSNLLPNHLAQALVTAGETLLDTFAVTGDITVVFNRAVDTVLIKSKPSATYFDLRKSGTTASVPIDLSFSSDAKTVTLNPVSALEKGVNYKLLLNAVPGNGITYAPALLTHSGTVNGAGANTITTADFKTKSDPKADVSNLAVSIALDTNSDNNVVGKRKGASGGNGAYSVTVGAINVNTESALRILVNEAAWNSNHTDSVDAYEVRVRASSRSGVKSGWYYSAAHLTTSTYSAFNVATNAANSQIEKVIDLSGQSFISNLRVHDFDAAGTDYTNGDNIFNDSTQLEVQVRVLKDRDGVAGYAGQGETGTWSNTVAFFDNVAPCDPDFVPANQLGSNPCADVNKGGISISTTITWNHVGGPSNDSSGFLTLTFPEDMDITTKPNFIFKYGNWNVGVTPTIPTRPKATLGNGTNPSGWTNARTYVEYVNLPALGDYTNGGVAGRGYYMNISVTGMKDISGNTISAYGSSGNGIEGTDALTSGINGQQNGSSAVKGWIR